MNQLTTLETALLEEFKSLGAEFARLAEASQASEHALLKQSETFSSRIATLANRQNALEERLDAVTEALNRQTASTEALINSVNRLMSAQR